MASKASVTATATGEAVAGPAVIHGLHIEATATAGQVVVKDGGGSGTTLIDISTAAVADNHYVPFEGGGIQFATDVHVSTLSNITSVTFIQAD